MHRKELNERSPLRVLEQSIHGGLGRGNLGVVVARHGVGKSAFLVGVALDDLMRGREVLHVSLTSPMDKVRTFYDELFTDLARTERLEDVRQARLDLEKHRRIQCYLDTSFSQRKLRDAIRFWKLYSEFSPAAIVIEGFDFDAATTADMAGFKEIARAANAEMWMSAVTTRDAERNARGIPEPVAHLESSIDVILVMAHDGKAVHVGLCKDHDSKTVSPLRLALDPTTMLLVKE